MREEEESLYVGKSFGFNLHVGRVRFRSCKVITELGIFIRFGLFLKFSSFCRE